MPDPETKEMTGEEAKAALPLCPYCEKPFSPAGARYNIARVQLQVHYCKECRKVITVEILQEVQSRIMIPPSRFGT